MTPVAAVNSDPSVVMERIKEITQLLGNEPLDRQKIGSLKVLSSTFISAAGTQLILSDGVLSRLLTCDHESSHIPVPGTRVVN